ncbi:unnamed protein product [Cylicostephanus goldi]|uniref:Uncharacterized protein n=1 Tax=Cylicostephanus goldi TaxID=71465 RepID=A0A3P7PJN3_CYLGO|nr:unnamed protein product [Cylicostephanus goldi]
MLRCSSIIAVSIVVDAFNVFEFTIQLLTMLVIFSVIRYSFRRTGKDGEKWSRESYKEMSQIAGEKCKLET